MGAAISMFEDCFKGKRAAFGNKRRHLVNLQDMGVDIYEPADLNDQNTGIEMGYGSRSSRAFIS